MWRLEQWLVPYQIKLSECDLMRVPKWIVWNGRVQTMVGKNLKPLADRLWDTDSSKDIETLDWMKNLRCEVTDTRQNNEKYTLKKNSNNARKKTHLLAEAIMSDKRKRSNQWNIIK